MPDDITFISYAREDANVALRLADDLRTAGVRVWIDERDIPPGQHWDRVVEQALEQSTRLLIVLSPDAVNSTPVRDEIAYALAAEKPIIPLLFRECRTPLRLVGRQHIDFTESYDAGLKKLVGGKVTTVNLQRHAFPPVENGGRVGEDAAVATPPPPTTRADERAERLLVRLVAIGSVLGCSGGVALPFLTALSPLATGLLVVGGGIVGAFAFGAAGFFIRGRLFTLTFALGAFVAAFIVAYKYFGVIGVAWALWGGAQAAALVAASIAGSIQR